MAEAFFGFGNVVREDSASEEMFSFGGKLSPVGFAKVGESAVRCVGSEKVCVQADLNWQMVGG